MKGMPTEARHVTAVLVAPCDLDVLKAVICEARLPGFRATAAVAHVRIRSASRAQVRCVQRPIWVQALCEAQRCPLARLWTFNLDAC